MEKKMKIKKGWIGVEVGLEEELDGSNATRFVIPISYLYHSLFQRLLDKAHDVYGYHVTGPLKLPCSVDEFLRLRRQIERDAANQRHRHHHHKHLSGSLSSHF